MNFEIVTKKEMSVCGLRTELTTSQNENYRIIRNHWQKFNRKLQKNNILGGSNWKKFGITLKKDNKYEYLTAVPLDIGIDGFESLVIPEGQFACFQHLGRMDLIKNTVYNIYKKIIPESGLVIDKERELIHYEYYNHRFNWNRDDSIIGIYVPVYKKI